MDIISAMRFFVLINESSSFSEASEKLNVAPSSVSRKLTTLEEELGTKLIQRNTRNMRLTEAGERFLKRSQVLLDDLDQITSDLRGLRDSPKGKLKLTLPVILAEHYIAPILQQFHQAYPDIEVELIGDDKIIDLMRSDFDLSIRVGTLKDSQLISRRLGPLKYRLCASPAYLQKHGTPTTIAELQDHNCLSFKHPIYPKLWSIQAPRDSLKDVAISGSLCCNSEATLLQSVRSGLGLSLLIDWHTEEYIRSGELVELMSDHVFTLSFMRDAEVFIVYPQREYLPEKVRSFVEFLIKNKRNTVASASDNNCT